jgi:hypothetical protein
VSWAARVDTAKPTAPARLKPRTVIFAVFMSTLFRIR